MSSFRTRVLSLLILVFAAVPAFAQETTTQTLNPASSIGCLGIGVIAMLAVGGLAASREAQSNADLPPSDTTK